MLSVAQTDASDFYNTDHLHQSPHFYAGCPSCCNPPNLSWLMTGTGKCWIAYPHGFVSCPVLLKTRHRASTSMYSLTFCVRVMSSEYHHWKPAVQAATGMLRTPASPAGHQLAMLTHPRKREFALCCHSNATSSPIANPPNSAQLGGSLYHAPKLHPGPCRSVGVRPRTDTHTDARDHNTFCVIYDSRKM